MPELPKIVRERLQVIKPLANHPDSDVLTAFTEQSLAPSERALVFEHLAHCGNCRDVIALALPANESVEVAGLNRDKAGFHWGSWPVLRWSLVFAGIALAAIGVLRYQHSDQPKIETFNAPSQNQPSQNQSVDIVAKNSVQEVRPQSTANIATGTAKEQEQKQNPAKDNVEERSNAAPAAGSSTASIAASVRNSSSAPALDKSASSAGSIDAQHQNQILQAENDPAAQPHPFTDSVKSDFEKNESAKLSKAKPAAPRQDQSITATLTPPSVPLQTRPSLLQGFHAPVAQWSISSTGNLQRSFDDGKNWQEITVAEASMPAVNSLPSEDAAKKAPTQPASFMFRAVAANFPEVWAGGSAGVLYHSIDEGAHWTRVIASASGIFLTGDIINVEFTDPRHGKISTSTSEIWMTADSGNSWQKQ